MINREYPHHLKRNKT